MTPCAHIRFNSYVTGLDSEGVCLTCGTSWSADDVIGAATRARTIINTLCVYCVEARSVTGDDLYVLERADTYVMVFDCEICTNTVYRPTTPEFAAVLRDRHVLITDRTPITRDEIKAFEITLYGVDDLARLAQQGLAS
jgi:hypothetical protein